MSENPLPISEEDDTEGHCLAVRLADIEAAERQVDTSSRLPWARGAQAEATPEEAPSEDVAAQVPGRDLGR